MLTKAFIIGVENYRGFCVGAIMQTSHVASNKESMILALPSSVSYDQYIGVVSICESSHVASDKRNMILAMFNK